MLMFGLVKSWEFCDVFSDCFSSHHEIGIRTWNSIINFYIYYSSRIKISIHWHSKVLRRHFSNGQKGSSVWQRDIRVKYYETKLWDIMTIHILLTVMLKRKQRASISNYCRWEYTWEDISSKIGSSIYQHGSAGKDACHQTWWWQSPGYTR